jgi:hypothetical protein
MLVVSMGLGREDLETWHISSLHPMSANITNIEIRPYRQLQQNRDAKIYIAMLEVIISNYLMYVLLSLARHYN